MQTLGPMIQSFSFLLNVAIESNIAGGFTQSAMEVDYVCVYQSGNLVWSDEFNSNSISDSDCGAGSGDPVDPVDPAGPPAAFTGAFGGALVDGDTYTFPSGAETVGLELPMTTLIYIHSHSQMALP